MFIIVQRRLSVFMCVDKRERERMQVARQIEEQERWKARANKNYSKL